MPKQTESGAVRLHYEVSGYPLGEVLVLANSLGSNLRMWARVLHAFESKFRVLRFAMRGKKSGCAGAFHDRAIGASTFSAWKRAEESGGAVLQHLAAGEDMNG